MLRPIVLLAALCTGFSMAAQRPEARPLLLRGQRLENSKQMKAFTNDAIGLHLLGEDPYKNTDDLVDALNEADPKGTTWSRHRLEYHVAVEVAEAKAKVAKAGGCYGSLPQMSSSKTRAKQFKQWGKKRNYGNPSSLPPFLPSKIVTFINMVITGVKNRSPDMIPVAVDRNFDEKKDKIPPGIYRLHIVDFFQYWGWQD